MRQGNQNSRKHNVLLGVTGGIAAYKACELTRLFIKEGHSVRVIMTENSKRFISPLTLETLSGNRVCSGFWDNGSFSAEHVSLAKWGDILIVAPATANAIGKFASGIADDALSTVFLSFSKPVLIAPAMHDSMIKHRCVRDNIERLRSIGVAILDPARGDLASGDFGEGRLAEPSEIKKTALSLLGAKRDMEGKKILITAGPTREHIDPVRFISSPSSGKMGSMIAEEASKRGASVTLVHGPMSFSPNFSGRAIEVTTANEMHRAVMRNKDCDIFIGSAAVSDYRPKSTASAKIKKSGSDMSIELKPNVDIIEEFSSRFGRGKVVIGFAAETDDTLRNASAKLTRKKLDMIVANDVSNTDSGFGSDFNTATIISRRGDKQTYRRIHKRELANIILDRAISLKKR